MTLIITIDPTMKSCARCKNIKNYRKGNWIVARNYKGCKWVCQSCFSTHPPLNDVRCDSPKDKRRNKAQLLAYDHQTALKEAQNRVESKWDW